MDYTVRLTLLGNVIAVAESVSEEECNKLAHTLETGKYRPARKFRRAKKTQAITLNARNKAVTYKIKYIVCVEFTPEG